MAALPSLLNISTLTIAESIEQGDRVMLGRAITLVESKNPDHIAKADLLLSHIIKSGSGSALRIAISGAPGVGKSTFIDSLGIQIINEGLKVAVLSVDPSSDINKGSILGDKTRMEKLSVHADAFIRPSPAGNFLGGIAWRTREAMVLLEAAGYDIIFVETVGVGQSEHKVKEMVDCFVLLLLPGGGDELQGMKKGIVEMADILSIHKCDGDQIQLARQTQKEYQQALHLSPKKKINNWQAEVITTSSITGEGIDQLWKTIQIYQDQMVANGFFEQNRLNQNESWFNERIALGIQEYVRSASGKSAIAKIKENLRRQKTDPIAASNLALQEILDR
ncbi:MAG: methylmalonyl Co-A mutase-associated GTPase MeaB [Bacteroidia bacterium]|nr:methylmalonyl Co-A mutase-associated GTPase MeaB [Bacteroidia bacterium]